MTAAPNQSQPGTGRVWLTVAVIFTALVSAGVYAVWRSGLSYEAQLEPMREAMRWGPQ